MNKKIEKIEAALLVHAQHHAPTFEPGPRWKSDLMRDVRLMQPQTEPIAGLGPLTWKWTGVALALTLVLSTISARYGNVDDYLLKQTEMAQTADYLLSQSF